MKKILFFLVILGMASMAAAQNSPMFLAPMCAPKSPFNGSELMAGSPCFGKGTQVYDKDGKPMITGKDLWGNEIDPNFINIGAYQGPPIGPVVSPPPPPLMQLITLIGTAQAATQAETDAAQEVWTKIMPLYANTNEVVWKLRHSKKADGSLKMSDADYRMASMKLETFLRTFYAFMDQQGNFLHGTDTTEIKAKLTDYVTYVKAKATP